MLLYANFVRSYKRGRTNYQVNFHNANDKGIQFPHHRKHGLHFVDRMDTLATEITEVYYINHKGHINTFWIVVLYVKPCDTYN